MRASVAIAAGFYWTWIGRVFAVAQSKRAGGGEGVGVAAIARGEDAVEHIDTGRDGGGDVAGEADAHEIAGFIFWEEGCGVLKNLHHGVKALADGQAADGVAGEIQFDEFLGASLAKVEVGAALYDSEKGLIFGALVGFLTFGGPTERAGDGLLVIDPLRVGG